ncbi:MAG: outer membrane protein assembly factor BamE [Gammaproteobacteria bacterium]|jgi:outer membrane protein assembly factor BamE|nr:outer membrane protein assembly factor BamE [Gammaproteobacteria bacterium]NBD95425.1 outer membrane protein assembly factor BamE [Gammaproteobacteria bacterium]
MSIRPINKCAAAALALCALLLVSACGSLVYKQNIQQGNVLDRDKVEQLETGMTKRQVQVLLGTPSVSSPFHDERWDYMNTYARRGGTPERRVLTLRFDGDRLASIEGDYLDEGRVAGEALDELQSPDELPVQDLDSIREQADQRDPTG